MGRRWAASAVPTFLSAAAFTCAASLMIFAQALTWELPGDGGGGVSHSINGWLHLPFGRLRYCFWRWGR